MGALRQAEEKRNCEHNITNNLYEGIEELTTRKKEPRSRAFC
jgi:hypothetical protein